MEIKMWGNVIGYMVSQEIRAASAGKIAEVFSILIDLK